MIEEHLREVRCLRQRLEESIRTNERLRQQLEERLATTGRDGGTLALIHFSNTNSANCHFFVSKKQHKITFFFSSRGTNKHLHSRTGHSHSAVQ